MQVQITKAMKETEAKVLESAKPAFEDIKDERRDTKLIALVAHNNMKPTMMTFVAQRACRKAHTHTSSRPHFVFDCVARLFCAAQTAISSRRCRS